MEFDKSHGLWYNDTYHKLDMFYEKTYLDDVAYQLYLNWTINKNGIVFNQIALLINPEIYEEYYQKALYIVRTEKLERITNGIG